MDPEDVPDDSDDNLEALWDVRNNDRNFITYYGDAMEKEHKVRVNCKTWPTDNLVSYPPPWIEYRKTTLVQWKGRREWDVLSSRIHPNESTYFERGSVAKMCVFLQEPRHTPEPNSVAYVAQGGEEERVFDPIHDSKHVATMSRKQRKLADEGIAKCNREDDAMCACLATKRKTSVFGRFGKMLCILPALMGEAAGIRAFPAENVSNVTSVLEQKPEVVVSYLDTTNPSSEYLQQLEQLSQDGTSVVHFADQFPGNFRNSYKSDSLEWVDGRGNLSFLTNNKDLASQVKQWADGPDRWTAPMSVGDLATPALTSLAGKLEDSIAFEEANVAFPAEMEEEERNEKDDTEFLDCCVDDEDFGNIAEDILSAEQSMLEELPLPGTPLFEKERRAQWLKLPRHARAAIRRMHAQFGHCPNGPLREVLKAARVPEQYLKAVEHFKCESCERNKKLPKQTHKVALPRPYIFNHSVGIDVDYVYDYDNVTIMLLNIVDLGTGFQMQTYLRTGKGTPKSSECYDAFMQSWVSWAGYPEKLICDRGLNNRGVFIREMSAAGVDCSNVGLEAAYQLGKVERHGGIWKKVAAKVIDAKKVRGEKDMHRLVSEVNAVVNEMSRTGGFSPAQWVTGRQPRYAAGERGDNEQAHQLNAMEERLDPTTVFAQRMEYRHEAKKAFVHEDSSKKVAAAMLRKATPLVGDYRVGDLISFQREQGSDGIPRKRWSPASRIIGFEGDKVCWVLCHSVPFCLATDRIRPANESEVLAYQYLHDHADQMPRGTQQAYIDETSLNQSDVEERQYSVLGEEEDLPDLTASEDENDVPPLAQVVSDEDDEDDDEKISREAELEARVLKRQADIEAETQAQRRRKEVTDDYPQACANFPALNSSTRTELRASSTPPQTPTELRARSRSPPRTPIRNATEEQRDLQRLEDSPGESLLDVWNRNATSGQGVEVLRRKKAEEDDVALLAFLADGRLPLPMAKKYGLYANFTTANEKKEQRGKTLNYENESKEIREGLDISRKTEWEKWTKFVAGRPCRGEELKKLLNEGHVPIPTRWVDVDKAAHRRRKNGPFVPAEYKSRLCGRGDLEGIDGLRADSPTAEIESHHLVFSFAAAHKLRLKTADISNAYFQGEQMDRLLLLKPPKGGIPDPEYEDGETLILARVPIYGTTDAGRKFWKRFKHVIESNDFRENKIAKALYVIEVNGEIKAMMITHVDDLCYAVVPEFQDRIDNILESFAVRKVEEGEFRFCGKEIKQLDDFSIVVTCKDSTETINPVKYSQNGRKMTANATEAEIGQMRSVVGSLGWIARQCRPGLSYMVSKLQGAVSKATVQDLKETNSALTMAKDYSDMGITFRSDAVSWTDMIVVTVTDASFAQETDVEPSGRVKPHRSQKAFAVLLVHPDIVTKQTAGCHLWCWRSLTDKRVCRATIQAEAHGMISGEEMGTRLRAIIADCKGLIPDLRDWERASSACMKHLALSDCESLVSHLKNPKNERLENVRLSIDIQGLKQVLWEKPDGTDFDELPPDTVAENVVRWIDTSAMIVDCLTKKMSPEVMHKLQTSGILDLNPTAESVTTKMKKGKQRRAKTEVKDRERMAAEAINA